MCAPCRKQGESLSKFCQNIIFIISFLDARAIDNGANAIAEGFLFGVAALLIIGETWRSSRNQSKRREGVDDKLEELQASLEGLAKRVDSLTNDFDERWSDEKQRYPLPLLCSLSC